MQQIFRFILNYSGGVEVCRPIFFYRSFWMSLALFVCLMFKRLIPCIIHCLRIGCQRPPLLIRCGNFMLLCEWQWTKKTIHFLNWNEKNAGTRLLDDQTNKTQLVITFVVRLMVVTMDWTNSRFRSIIQIDREINWIMYVYYGGAMRVYATFF